MADDRLQVAVDIVARAVIDRVVSSELGDQWADNYPEVGEHDWLLVQERVTNRLLALAPPPEEFEAAYEYLEGRTENHG